MPSYPASIPRCQHIKINGTQCGSPALRRRRFCFFHQQWRQERIALGAKRVRSARSFDLPVLEDANSIQITLMQIMRLILRGQLDPKSAGLLLYALQTASVNLRHTEFEPRLQTDIVLDPRDAPDTPLGEHQWYPEDFEDEEEETEDEEEDAEDEDAEDEDQAESGDEEEPEEKEGISTTAEKETKAATVNTAAFANDQRRTTNDADSDRKKPPATTSATNPQATAANGQRPTTKNQGTARWFAPDGTPVTGAKLNELRLLTHFIDCIAPLPPGEKDDD